jgi:hypothetical protein
MNVLKKIDLIWNFYKNFIFLSLLITLICAFLLSKYHFIIFPILFWIKVATLGISYIFINSYKKHEYYYYRNLGLSKSFLWLSSIALDISIFILLMFITSKFS